MSKGTRKFFGLLSAVVAYYIIHEGAHLIYALSIGAFKQINFMGLGMQIDVYAERMSNTQLGIFCLVGAVATLIAAYGLVAATDKICEAKSKLFKACMYYVTIAMLLVDPLYLSLLYGFVGGGDMNGIALLVPEWIARVSFGLLLLVNGLVFWKLILPKYKKSFSE
ncbi:MAG: hypothetical protein GX248_12135 [Peptococcaceae bacterium]|jgi:hypothetical protein|nr:hypothetical protein [Peptococcaceae bacterium]